ncbi:MAG: hypothetical protein SO161_03925 [Treponema sp.]|nr:hypothetical protein [Treponema sp.]
MDTANRLMEPEWDNDEAKTANELVMHTGMRADFYPHENGFIFYSTVKDKPMDSKQFGKYLKRALAEIGYADSKDICFHS